MERRQVIRKLATELRQRKREAADKHQMYAHRVAVAAREETWEKGQTLAPSTRSRWRRRHRHRGKGKPRDALRSAAADFDRARRVDAHARSGLGDACHAHHIGAWNSLLSS